MAVGNSFRFQRAITIEFIEVFKDATKIFLNQIAFSIKMNASTEKCRTHNGIAKHLKKKATRKTRNKQSFQVPNL